MRPRFHLSPNIPGGVARKGDGGQRPPRRPGSGRHPPRARACALALLSALAACSSYVPPAAVTPDGHADLSQCGRGIETAVGPLLAAADLIAPIAETAARLNDDAILDGINLVHAPGAVARIEAALAPGDILLIARHNTVFGRITPGYLTHGLFALGSEAQLRALGLWDDAALAPWHGRIAAGARIIDAAGTGPVDLRSVASVAAEGLAIFRPRDTSAATRRARLRAALAMQGLPFDYRFDAATPEAVFCTEYLDHIMPDMGLPRDPLTGREVILPDRIAQAAFEGDLPLDLVLFLYADSDGLHDGSPALLRATIAANWPGAPAAGASADPP
ncbi:MAG: hypothetical protein IT542_13785 [Rubellimicrobium sp.]|nr:hypothetical protein [Rubellimicrobium sp.]